MLAPLRTWTTSAKPSSRTGDRLLREHRARALVLLLLLAAAVAAAASPPLHRVVGVATRLPHPHRPRRRRRGPELARPPLPRHAVTSLSRGLLRWPLGLARVRGAGGFLPEGGGAPTQKGIGKPSHES